MDTTGNKSHQNLYSLKHLTVTTPSTLISKLEIQDLCCNSLDLCNVGFLFGAK